MFDCKNAADMKQKDTNIFLNHFELHESDLNA